MNNNPLPVYAGSPQNLPSGGRSTEALFTASSTDSELVANPALQPFGTGNPKPLRFAIFGDNTGGARPGVLADAVSKANLIHPDFIIGIGDLVEGGVNEVEACRAEWKFVDATLKALTVPFISIPGNHDYTTPAQERVWRERYGKTYQAFMLEDVLFILLNSDEKGYGALGDDQIEFVAETLRTHPTPRWTFVFVHQPCWRMHRNKGWREIEEMLRERPHTAFAGHVHFYEHTVINGWDYITLATTGGSATTGKHGDGRAIPDEMDYIGPPRGAQVGEFDAITLVTLPAEASATPLIVNLELSGFYPLDVRSVVSNPVQMDLYTALETAYDPVFTSEEFVSGTSHLRFINKSKFPVRVKGTHQGVNGIICEPAEFEVEIAPESVTGVPAALTAPHPMAASTAAWTSNWSVTMAKGPDTTTAVTGSKLQRPAVRLATHKTRNSITIDGTLEDWAGISFHRQSSSDGDSRRGFSWATTYDDSWVYLAVVVDDPDLGRVVTDETESERMAGSLYHDQTGKIFKYDALEIRFSGAKEPLRSTDNGWHWFRDHLMIGFFPPTDALPAQPLLSKKLPVPVRHSLKRTPNGYVAELAIPIAYIKEQQGEAWEAYRVHITVHDRSSDGGFRRYSSQPDWRSVETISGSGTCFRAE